ncbi:hypothetical protein CANCADRAFT_12619, partial [Tortispora caseinolytica NRRL Y-17796]
AVAADVPICSKMGVDMLKRGGNAVDAAITTTLCIGVVNMFSSGIGGGGFMLIRPHNDSPLAINFREMAPEAAHKHMYDDHPLTSKIGGKAVGIPGELAGLWAAHERYGSLSWKELFDPVVDLARKGFPMPRVVHVALKTVHPFIFGDMAPSANWSFLWNDQHDRPYKTGELIKREALANTLERVSVEGITAFYNSSLTHSMVNEAAKSGGVITYDDFSKYQVSIEEPISTYFHGKEVITLNAPTSGPALLFGLNLIEGIDGPFAGHEHSALSQHYIIESMKWMSSARTQLGDPVYMDNVEHISAMQTKKYAADVRRNVSADRTYNWRYYNPSYEPNEEHGTAHLSVIDKHGMAVSLTTTVNLYFGCMVHDAESGVILNSEMDDFSVPKTGNAFDLQPSIYNYIEPFKRPLSSTVPVIVTDNNYAELVIGAAGGSHIITTVFQAISRIYLFKQGLEQAVKNPRLHDQLIPETTYYESGMDSWRYFLTMRGLKGMGHNLTCMDPRSVMNGIVKDVHTGEITAVSDWWRK